MLRSAKELRGYVLEAKDGDIGRCKDFLFDDEKWTVRYMVADTGKWIPDKRVLISPLSLGEPNWESKRLPIRLTQEQVKKAPSLSWDEPVSRQHEVSFSGYYGYPYYWVGNSLWGPAATPRLLEEWVAEEEMDVSSDQDGDPHLRSVEEVAGYHIAASDGEIGHVEEFILDDETWAVRYLVVDTRNWLPGRKVLISPRWVEDLDWADDKARVSLTTKQVKDSPPYDPKLPINREYEAKLYDFYGRPRYW